MSFISVPFLAVFLPVTFLIYWIFRKHPKVQNAILVAASLIFYACYDWKYLIFLAVSVCVTYFGAALGLRHPDHSKKLYLTALVLNLLLLLVFKYTGFTLESLNKVLVHVGIQLSVPTLLLPVGLSFYIFQSSTYLLDLLLGKRTTTVSFMDYLLFVSFFPTITSGPIQRSCEFLPRVAERKHLSFTQFEMAIFTFLWGAFLKMIIADRIHIFTSTIFPLYGGAGGVLNVVAMLLYSIEIYADFAGYSYMAIAVAALFGYPLKENFHQPYFATSIADFWRRWHISLTSFFKDYLYIPLGGNRKGTLRWCINVMIVFLVSGLWHGAAFAFLFWGAIHGVYQIAGKLTKGAREKLCAAVGIRRETVSFRIWQSFVVYLLVSVAWVFFRMASFKSACEFFVKMFSIHMPWMLFDGSFLNYGLGSFDWVILLVAIILWIVVSFLRERGYSAKNFVEQNAPAKIFVFAFAIIFIAVYGIYGESFQASDFIYAGF